MYAIIDEKANQPVKSTTYRPIKCIYGNQLFERLKEQMPIVYMCM